MNYLLAIQIFKRVVEIGSFSKASDELAVSQSSATKHITQLEQHVGARLLNRNTRGVSLTEDGAIYYQRCRRIIAEIEDADESVGRRRHVLSGTLRISTSVAFGRRVLAPMLIDFMRAHAQVKIDLVCDDRYLDLVSHGIDLALRMGTLPDSSLGCRYIGYNPWVMIASPSYLVEHSAPQEPNDLKKHNCIVYSSVQGDAVWQLRAPSGESFAIVVDGPLRSNDLSTLLAAVKSGQGIAILPRYVASGALSAGEVTTVLGSYSIPGQDLHTVFPSAKQVPAKTAAFIEFLLPRFKKDWWQHAA